ncbi:MAG: helix-turn-helix domain-containing protein [Verrucomicrobia bacterium]|nr:helix-turn-helix domain-containing protein [Verrucomicrobiota bacterium]
MNQTHILTLKEAATFLRVKPITVRRLIFRKKLKRIPYVRPILIPLSSILRLVEAAQ